MVGTKAEIEEIIESAKKGDSIEILNGDLDLNVENGGVSIVNKGDGNVTVNNKQVDDTGIVTENNNENNNPSTGTSDKPTTDKQDVQSPNTYDNNNLTLFYGSAFISLIALLAIIKKKFA